jgi:hypothetical protein
MLRRKHQALRGVLAHSPAIAISMLAVVFALGSGAGYAASAASNPHPPVLAFHHLKMGRGWTGDLQYAYANGIVYLTGSANGNHRKTPVMAKLPRSIAPKDSIFIPISLADGDGTLQVVHDGVIEPSAPGGSDFLGFVSLGGVSFAAGAP